MKMTILVAVIRTGQPITVKSVVTGVAAATSHPATMTPQKKVQAVAAAVASPPALIIQQPTQYLVTTEVILKLKKVKKEKAK